MSLSATVQNEKWVPFMCPFDVRTAIVENLGDRRS